MDVPGISARAVIKVSPRTDSNRILPPRVLSRISCSGHAVNTKDALYQGKRVTQVPENSVNLWGDYTFTRGALDGLMLGAGVRYFGKSEITADNSLPATGGNTQYDVAVSYDLGVLSSSLKGLTVKAGAQNLTNKMTYTCYSSSYCWIGRDRTWQAGVNYHF